MDISRQKIRKKVINEHEGLNTPEEKIEEIVASRLRDEVSSGIQTIQYQLITIQTTNGQAPFATMNLNLGEVEEGLPRNDLAMLIEEVLNQRILGVKNEKGVYVTPGFPKLIYVLDEFNIHEDSKYWYLTELAAKCTAKRMVPDYVSAKKMREYKIWDENEPGSVYPPMGCRSFLTPDRSFKKGNMARAKNFVPGKPKYYGRFNQGRNLHNLWR